MLSPEEKERYARSLSIIGKEGQEKLKQAKVLVVGAGGLGSPAAFYLAAAGVGTLGIVDFDTVQVSNLQRQLLHTNKDLHKPKIDSAKETLQQLNPHITLQVHNERLTEDNVALISEYELVLDGSDSLETKHLLNQACQSLDIPLVYGAAVGEEGQLAVFLPGEGCLQCIISTPDAPTCQQEGVLPTAPGLIGTLQAHEALKLLLGKPKQRGLLTLGPSGFKTFHFNKNPDCPTCGPTREKQMKSASSLLGDFKTNKQKQSMDIEISPKEAEELFQAKKAVILDVREPFERDHSSIEGSLFIPLRELESRLQELPKDTLIIAHCHSGIRSFQAAQFLQEKGFQSRSLSGGIERWFLDIEL